tara:strand:- start:2794 stop:5040 length:2247 start_codon:yes stop_codon:yes gene_type:complete
MINKKFLKKLFYIFIFQIVFINYSNSETIKKFNIIGNDRVTDETIIMFSNLEVGDEINVDILNNSLKNIYLTNYFKSVSASNKNGIVEIKVEENPIIQSILINGIDKNFIIDSLEKVTSKIEKYPFVENKIKEQTILLKNILKSYGYYYVTLKSTIIKNDNNTIDLIYDFDLGEIAKTKKINFIGNKVFRDSTLRNIIISEEAKFWKFLTRNKFLDSNRIDADIVRLKKYYQNQGYYNVKIKSSSAIINEQNQFEIIFNIDAGNKYYFNDISISKNLNFDTDRFSEFEKRFKKIKGKKYSKKIVNKIIDDLNIYTLRNDFIFINATYDEILNKDNTIDIIIKFKDIEKQFVERINILGNFITDEKVIRNTLIVDEGDPFNKLLFEKSIQNVKAKNIFKTVNYEISSIDDSNKIININVEEKPTGEIFAGAGTGTVGTTLSAGIKENNYLGLGIKLDTNLLLTEDSIKGKFSVINPNFKNSDKSIKTVIESSSNDFMSASGYKTSRTGFILGTGFEQMDDLFVNLDLSNFYEDLETSSTASDIVKKQEGNYFENLLSYSISYNKLDQNFQPSDGFINKFSQTLPIYSDDLSIENSFSTAAYHSVNDNLILSAKFLLKSINSLEDNVRVSKRVYIPGRLLRGFESGKIGPKEGSQYIGGNYAAALNLSSTLPNIFYENENLDFNLFLDMANVWKVDYNDNLDSNKIRSSTGLALNWFSPVGPMTFSYAIPISEAETDITEKFRFQIGTSF